ncbi:MAG: hypothetical protein PHO04_01705 [Candidatus Pacebacteria bacterium]|nr:hypothetical protein [Candidatus Paceibacterota bacterium]
MNSNTKQKGSLYLTVLMVGLLISIIVGVIGIIVSSSNLGKGLGDSLRAFHIADSGMEQALYQKKQKTLTEEEIDCPADFDDYGISSCTILVEYDDGNNIESIKAIGSYNGSQRVIQLE